MDNLSEKLIDWTSTQRGFSRIIDPVLLTVRMAHPQKFITLDLIYKSIGSLLPPRNGRTVQMMDRLTMQELKGSIIHESCSNGEPKFALGFLIDVIFATCRQESIPNVDELTVPLKAICIWNNYLQEKFTGYPESSEVLLYDSKTEGWNWAFDPGDVKEVGSSMVDQSNGTPLCQEKEFTHFLNTLSMAIKHKLHTSETKLELSRIFTAH